MWTITIQQTLQGFYVNEILVDEEGGIQQFHESFNSFKGLVEALASMLDMDEESSTAEVFKLVKQETEDEQE